MTIQHGRAGLATVVAAGFIVGTANGEQATPVVPARAPEPAAVGDVVGTATSAPAHDLQVRYAQARLRLAELDLQRARAANESLPHSIGDREIERLENHVAMLRRQVEIAREHPRTAARQAATAAAEAACADTRADLEVALRANERTPGAVSGINVERLRAKVDLAEIRLALCSSPEYELSLLAELEWNIEQLTDEVIDLRHRVETGAKHDAGQSR